MNWILTILFLVVFSLLNISGGSALLQASGYNNNSKMKSWIIGYFAMFYFVFSWTVGYSFSYILEFVCDYQPDFISWLLCLLDLVSF